MRKILFDEEELLVLSVFEVGPRRDMIYKLEDILPEVREDPDMEAIVISAAEKLKRITDKEFGMLDLEEYREEYRVEAAMEEALT